MFSISEILPRYRPLIGHISLSLQKHWKSDIQQLPFSLVFHDTVTNYLAIKDIRAAEESMKFKTSKQVTGTRHVQLKWLLEENDNSNCVRNCRLPVRRSSIVKRIVKMFSQHVFVCHQFGKRNWLCASRMKLFIWIEMTIYWFLSTYLRLMLLKSLQYVVFGVS